MDAKQRNMAKSPGAQPMDEPLKKHGDKMDLDKLGERRDRGTERQSGGAGEPQSSPLAPEKQGGISGP
jgi:hypothetical protein